ncbi:hypothetical protein PVAND_002045 [Polypedilum vanderplanki]|uniref:Reverse transcriptase/retrotransposon-derived protein RNase H-like domain-containing protein n=1 Tax=Polypedilum vanderplanki TaxID=319348 RepID=A0A9J6BR13_POLVA|nr:hypothetical protein PVAND_002045 [Polypedilum vanderplanki]
MLEAGIIERAPHTNSYVSPMRVVAKGKDDFRLVIDMRQANKAIKRKYHPIPMIENLLHKLDRAKKFHCWISKVHITSNLADVTEPLRRLTKSNESFRWEQEQQKAFEEIKRKLKEETVPHALFDSSLQCKLYTDASGVGLGAVLVQVQEDGTERAIMFASKSLTKTEATYPQIHREALAMCWAVEKFSYYLLGREFTVVTDNKALKHIFNDEVMRTEEDEELRLVMQAVESERWSSNLKYWKAFQNELTVRNGILLKGHQIVLPETLRGQALRNAHVAHAGCTAVARDNPPEPMIRTFLPHKPMDFVAIDHWSAAIITSKLLIITDYYSRYLWVIEVRDTTSVETIKAYYENNEDKYDKLAGKLAKGVQFYNNERTHSSTNTSPAELMFGRRLRASLPILSTDQLLIDDDVREIDTVNKHLGKEAADKRRQAKESEIEVGDTVFMRARNTDKLAARFNVEEPCKIVKENRSNSSD